MSDIMRRKYRDLTEEDVARISTVKDQGMMFVESCDILGSSRELSLAKTKMEEAVFWAVKHITGEETESE